jgi:putative membrane protein
MESRDWRSWHWIGLAIVVLLSVFAFFAAAATSSIGGHYGMMGGGMWGWGVLAMIALALVLLMILVAALASPREITAAAFHPLYGPGGQNARNILEQRYARGELTREDYVRIRGDLTGGSSQP